MNPVDLVLQPGELLEVIKNPILSNFVKLIAFQVQPL